MHQSALQDFMAGQFAILRNDSRLHMNCLHLPYTRLTAFEKPQYKVDASQPGRQCPSQMRAWVAGRTICGRDEEKQETAL
jgi:hypothetical protein